MKPVSKKMSDGEIKAILQAERANALGAEQSSDLSEQRIRAMDYYMGDMSEDMPAEDGQSSAVSTDVQDVVEGVLPIVLDVFMSAGEKVVEFSPTREGDEDAAQQETDYVNHVFFQQNDGFLTLYCAFKDALLSKNSYVKWWMEKEETRTRESYKGLTEDAFAMLVQDTDISVVDLEQEQRVDPATGQPATYFNAIVEAVKNKRVPKIACFAPEEFLISKNAVDVPNAPYLAHIQRKPQADLIAQFPEKKQQIKDAPAAITTADNFEEFARQTVQDNQDQLQTADDVNTAMRMVEVAEHYIRLPLEKDDVARRYKITTIGSKTEILDIEEVTAWNIASGTAIIMPHRHFGRSLADLVIDIQQIKTSLLRATLNNAYFANNQRMEVSETHASENTIDDLLNNRVGGIVRTKMPGGLNQIETQSIGSWIAPIIEYVDSVTQKRTGVGSNNQGLDLDGLQNARTGAVTRIMDQAEMRIKLIARIFAETLMVNMMRGLHGMLQEFDEEEHVAKLNGKWVPINPREWKTRTRMTVSLPLGGATKQQLLGYFAQQLNVQKEIIQQQGGTNGPMVSYQNIYATVEQMTKLAGLKSVTPYFMQPPPPDQNAPPPPNPAMLEAQAKNQALQQTTQAGIAADQAKAQADAQRDAAKFQNDQAIEQMKLAAKHQQDQDAFAHKAALEKLEAQHKHDLEQFEAGAAMRLEAFKAQEKMKLDKELADHKAEIARTTAANKPKKAAA